MKVYYVSNRHDGCWYVRCYLPMVANGWDGDKTSPLGTRATAQRAAEGAVAADVVVFQRPDQRNAVEIAKMLKQAGKVIIFDNDDTYIPDSGVPTQIEDANHKLTLQKMSENLNEFMRIADACTTTTDFLAEEYKQQNPNTFVLPNAVDPDDWDEPLRNDSDVVRIGLIGSISTNSNYEPIIPLLEHYRDDPRVQFVLLGIPRQVKDDEKILKAYEKEIEFWSKQNVEWHYFVPMKDYQDSLNELRLDIMLIPRHDSYFNRAKSNIKFLEASMLEVPVIAQGFEDGNSPYEQDKEYCTLVYDNDKWIEETEKLIQSEKLRREIGKKAKAYVIDKYGIDNIGHLWEEAYEKVSKQRR